MFASIACIISAILLFWALDKHPYGYYNILRIMVCGTSAFCAYLFSEIENKAMVWIAGIIAILFNPIIPVHLSKEIWGPIDVIAGVILLVGMVFIIRD